MENFSCKLCFTFLRISTQCSSIGRVLFFASMMSFSVTEIISGAHFNDSPNLHNSCSPNITHMEPYSVKKQFQIHMRRNKINSGSNKREAHFWIRHRKNMLIIGQAQYNRFAMIEFSTQNLPFSFLQCSRAPCGPGHLPEAKPGRMKENEKIKKSNS